MTKQEEYGLVFDRKWHNGRQIPLVENQDARGPYSFLQFINDLEASECEAFIWDMDRCIEGGYNVDEMFLLDTRDILYKYPNVEIDGMHIISMINIKELLEEWLVFLRSE